MAVSTSIARRIPKTNAWRSKLEQNGKIACKGALIGGFIGCLSNIARANNKQYVGKESTEMPLVMVICSASVGAWSSSIYGRAGFMPVILGLWIADTIGNVLGEK